MYVVLLICISFVIFDATSLKDALYTITGMFGLQKVPFISKESIYYAKSYVWIILLAILLATPVLKNAWIKIQQNKKDSMFLCILETCVCMLLLLVCTAYLVDGSFNPFLYFRF